MDEKKIAVIVQNFHHIDAEVLEKISPAEMAQALKSQNFQCDEEIIARQIRIWALMGNHSKATEISSLIRWNCILPSSREQIKHSLPRVWRTETENEEIERHRPRCDFGYHYVAGGFYDPFYRSRNRSILRMNQNFEVKELTNMPDFVPGFASPSNMVIINGNVCVAFKTSYDINAKSHLAQYRADLNSWEDLGPIPAIGSFGLCAWKGGIVVVGGKKETVPSGRHNRMRTTSSEHVWFYDMESGIWAQLRPLSKSRINPTLVVLNEELYCCAGLSPSPADEDMVINNPETERLRDLTEEWETSNIIFENNTHNVFEHNGLIFAAHQERNTEKLQIGSLNRESDEITWQTTFQVPAGAQILLTADKIYIFGGILTEVAPDQLIPFEVLQMSERILSLDLADLENENGNPTLKSEDEITLCKKILLFCASICKGPVY